MFLKEKTMPKRLRAILLGKVFIGLTVVTILLAMITLLCEQIVLSDGTLNFKIAKLEKIPANQPFSFIVYGDTKDNTTIHKHLVKMFFKENKSNDVAFIVNTGDLVDDGDQGEEWQQYFINVVQPLAKKIPYFAAIGNHDYGEQGEGENFARLFRMYYTGYNFWYSFVYGNSIFIILDANLMTYDEDFEIPPKRAKRQYYWLEKVLESASKNTRIKHKFIFFHEAPFVSADKKVFGLITYHLDHAKALRTYKIDDNFFLDIFRKYDVDAVFLGHVHYYERWIEKYKREGDKKRITWVTTGGGGAINEKKWHSFTLGMRPPTVLKKKEKNKRIRPYNRRAKRAQDITNWSLSQGYPTRQLETTRALENHYCIVHVDGNSIWMEVKNKEQDLIEKTIIKKN